MKYSDLGLDSSKAKINAHQCYAGLLLAKEDIHHYRGGVYWKNISGTDYLIRDFGSRQNSLGKRTPKSEAIYHAFVTKKADLDERYASLLAAQQACARMCVATYTGHVPLIVAKIVRKLADTPSIASKSLIVGSNAIYAYEAEAGVRFEDELVATMDVDILLDTRRRIRVASSEVRGVIGLLKSVDSSFDVMRGTPFRAINKKGFMVDLIQPMQKDMRFSNQKSASEFPDDLSIIEVKGLDWLVSCPRFHAKIIDEKGYPAIMTAPDPRAFAMHKLWLSRQSDREPIKKRRDVEQANAVHDLVIDKLPFLSFNAKDLQAMPFKIRQKASEDFGFD